MPRLHAALDVMHCRIVELAVELAEDVEFCFRLGRRQFLQFIGTNSEHLSIYKKSNYF